MPQLPIYLDNNATTPVDPGVLEAMLPYFREQFGNAASRQHAFGWTANESVEIAREQVAKLIGADPAEIIFTAGATESDNLALKGVFESYAGKGNHLITCVTEHKAVLDTCAHLEKLGAEITYLGVDHRGQIDLTALEAAIRPTTILIALMYANNETGTIFPVQAIGAIAKKHGVIFFSDATQAVGKIPVQVLPDEIDLLALSAHKIYGPKGVGALYVRRRNPRVKLIAQMDGGGQERGMRSGTLNVPGIVGLGKAADCCRLELEADGQRLRKLRDRLEQSLLALDDVMVNGDTSDRLPQVSNLSFGQVEGKSLLLGFTKNIAVAAGSACTSASLAPSYVLKAMGLSDERAYASIRFSLGRFTTEEDIDYTIQAVTETVNNLRSLNLFV